MISKKILFMKGVSKVIKGFLYTVLIIFFILNVQPDDWRSPHLITKTIVVLTGIIIIGIRFSEFQRENEDLPWGRITLLGVFIGYGLFELEGYLLGE